MLLLSLLVSYCCIHLIDAASPHHFRMYNSSHHEKPWMALSEVDGLKNEDVVMLISSSEVKNFAYLRGRYDSVVFCDFR